MENKYVAYMDFSSVDRSGGVQFFQGKYSTGVAGEWTPISFSSESDIYCLSIGITTSILAQEMTSSEPSAKVYRFSSAAKGFLFSFMVRADSDVLKKVWNFRRTFGAAGIENDTMLKMTIFNNGMGTQGYRQSFYGWIKASTLNLTASDVNYVAISFAFIGLEEDDFSHVNLAAFPTGAKIFLGGREIPYINFNITTGLNSPMNAVIEIEPDPKLDLLPSTPVHIFVLDPVKKEYILSFEGYVTGTQSFKDSGQVVGLTLECISGLALLGQGSPLMSKIQGAIDMPIYGGTLPTVVASNGLAINLMFMDSINRVRSASSTQDIALALVSKDFISYLSTYNVSSLMGLARSNFLFTTDGIVDKLLTNLYGLSMVESLLKAEYQVSGGMTLFNMLVQGLESFQSIITQPIVPIAHKINEVAPFLSKNLNVDISISDYKQTLILPDLLYAVPPACNWVFESQILQISSRVDFTTLPTRKLTTTAAPGGVILNVMSPSIAYLNEKYKFNIPASGSNFLSVFVGEPQNITQTTTRMKQKTFDARSVQVEEVKTIIERAPTDLTFNLKLGKDREENFNLNMLLLPEEWFRGIIPSEGVEGYNKYYSFMNTGSKSEKGNDKDKKQDKQAKEVLDILQEIGDYALEREGRGRTLEVTLIGNIYIVSGFPIVIFDRHNFVIGYVEGMSLKQDVMGSCVVGVKLSNVYSLREGAPIAVPSWGISSLFFFDRSVSYYSDFLATGLDVVLAFVGKLASNEESDFYKAFEQVYNKVSALKLLDVLRVNYRQGVTYKDYLQKYNPFVKNTTFSDWGAIYLTERLAFYDVLYAEMLSMTFEDYIKFFNENLETYKVSHKGGKNVDFTER